MVRAGTRAKSVLVGLAAFGSLLLFVFFCYHHRYLPVQVITHLRPLEDIVWRKQVIVLRHGSNPPGRSDDIESLPGYLFWRDHVQVPPIPLVTALADDLLLLEARESLSAHWGDPEVYQVTASFYGGQVVEKRRSKCVLDEDGLKILVSSTPRQVLLIYRGADNLDKGLAYLTFLHLEVSHAGLVFTHEPAPIAGMFKVQPEERLRELFQSRSGTLYAHRESSPSLEKSLLGRFLRGQTSVLSHTSGVFSPDGRVNLTLRKDGCLVLEDFGGPEPLVFTHYVFGHDLSVFLLGRADTSGAVFLRLYDARLNAPELAAKEGS